MDTNMIRPLFITLIACLAIGCTSSEDKSTGAGHYVYLADSKTLYAINLDIENPQKVAITQFQELPIPNQVGPNIHISAPHVQEYFLAKNGLLPAKSRGLIYLDNHHFWGLDFNVENLVRPRQISKEYIETICAAKVIHDELYYRVGQQANTLSSGCSQDSSGWKKVNLDTKENEPAIPVMAPGNNLDTALLYNPATQQKIFLQATNQGVIGIFDAAFTQLGAISELKSIYDNYPISDLNGIYLLTGMNQQNEFGFYLFNVSSNQLTHIPNVIAEPSSARWSEYLKAFIVINRPTTLTSFGLLKINTTGETEQLVTLPGGYTTNGFKVKNSSIVYFAYSDTAGSAFQLNLQTSPITTNKLYDSIASRNPEPENDDWVTYQNETCKTQTPTSFMDYCASIIRGVDGVKVEIPSSNWVYNFFPTEMKRSNYLVVNTAAANHTPKVNLAIKQQPAGTFKTLIDLNLTQFPSYTEAYSADHRNDLLTYSISNDQKHVILIDNVTQTAAEISTSTDEHWLRGVGESYFAR